MQEYHTLKTVSCIFSHHCTASASWSLPSLSMYAIVLLWDKHSSSFWRRV